MKETTIAELRKRTKYSLMQWDREMWLTFIRKVDPLLRLSRSLDWSPPGKGKSPV